MLFCVMLHVLQNFVSFYIQGYKNLLCLLILGF